MNCYSYKKEELSKGRDTPEKELQAWIIKDALTNENKFRFDERIEFLTSELALEVELYDKHDSRKRYVVDLLGVDENGDFDLAP